MYPMKLLQEPRLSYFGPCPYIHEERCRFEYFYACDLDGPDLDEFLMRGWRKFGTYFFRPRCGFCKSCVPLRIPARKFKPTKSQRRLARKCEGIAVRFRALEYRDEIFNIYREHSRDRFGRESDLDEFIASFYDSSCPALQSEYYFGDELIAVGFLDVSAEALSSVYFVYKTAYQQYRLGSYSIIKETEHAALLGLAYYYLGYYVQENRSMAYKNYFHPHEIFDWDSQSWLREDQGRHNGIC